MTTLGRKQQGVANAHRHVCLIGVQLELACANDSAAATALANWVVASRRMRIGVTYQLLPPSEPALVSAKVSRNRLDFTVIDPYTLSKVGFELSPWSTHGLLSGIKGKTQKAINEEAQANFEREMSKLKAYFRKRGIPVLVYTDKDLQDHSKIFSEIEDYLTPAKRPKQLEFHALADFLAFDSPK